MDLNAFLLLAVLLLTMHTDSLGLICYFRDALLLFCQLLVVFVVKTVHGHELAIDGFSSLVLVSNKNPSRLILLFCKFYCFRSRNDITIYPLICYPTTVQVDLLFEYPYKFFLSFAECKFYGMIPTRSPFVFV